MDELFERFMTILEKEMHLDPIALLEELEHKCFPLKMLGRIIGKEKARSIFQEVVI